MKKGVTIHLLISLLLCICIFALTLFLGSNKDFSMNSLMLKLKSDYQMESAVVLALHKLISQSSSTQPQPQTSVKQLIAPNTYLTYNLEKRSDEEYFVYVKVEGKGINKVLTARFYRIKPPNNETDRTEAKWKSEFVPLF